MMTRARPGLCVWIGAVVLGLAALTDLGVSAADDPHGKIAFVRFSVSVGHPHIYSLTLGRKKAKRLPLLGPATGGPAWSPNGSMLAFVVGKNAPDSRDITGLVHLYVSTANGRRLRRLTHTASRVGAATWSPDGKRLAVVKSAAKGNGSSLWIVRVDGGTALRVTQGSIDLEPSWAPNGRTIAFLRVNARTYQGGIWVVRPDGSGLHRILSRFKNISEPVWSPDGTRLLVRDSRAIYSVTPAGGDRRTIARLSADARGAVEDPQPAWSPDGRWVAFCQLRSRGVEGSDIWIVRADGTRLRRLTRSPGVDTDPSWAP
jgi:TolB protein